MLWPPCVDAKLCLPDELVVPLHTRVRDADLFSTAVCAGDNQWESITWDKRAGNGRVTGESKTTTLNKAMRSGNVTTTQKFAAGTNNNSGGGKDLRKLDNESEDFTVKKVDASFSKALQSARLAKKMTQKALGTAINEKVTVVNEYESGKAIPNQQVVMKLNRALGVQLPSATGKKKSAKK